MRKISILFHVCSASFQLQICQMLQSLVASFCKWSLSFLTTFSMATKKHGVEHHISTTGLPVYAHARCLESLKLAVVKAEFAYMGELGIVQCSNSPWASPLHMVPKLDCSYGLCGDYHRLNDATIPVRYLVLHVRDFSVWLACKTIFSKVDFVRGYQQVPVHPDGIPKTAAVTPFGLFEFMQMLFGLKNATQNFQRLMDCVTGSSRGSYVGASASRCSNCSYYRCF